VPDLYRDGSIALGATQWQTVRRVVLPAASSGIITAVILGMGRAVGETMAVIMVAGNALSMPTSMLDPVSRKLVFDVLSRLKKERSMTVIVIEHSLENLIPLADEMVLMANGSMVLKDETHAFFQKIGFLLENGVYPPETILFFHQLKQAGLYQGDIPITNEEAVLRIREIVQRAKE